MSDKVKYGLCNCGCGERTRPHRQSLFSKGINRGDPQKYLKGHDKRKSPNKWSVSENGCWLWLRHINNKGYGIDASLINSGTRYAHRLNYESVRGPIPDGMVLDHLCGNPRCVNPDHLEPVTQRENCRRGRMAKLTKTDVMQIRELVLSGVLNREQAAKNYGVSACHVSRIVSGIKWAVL